MSSDGCIFKCISCSQAYIGKFQEEKIKLHKQLSLYLSKNSTGKRSPVFTCIQRCIFRLTCSHPEQNKDHVLTSAYVEIFRTVTRNAVNKSVWRKKDCSWPPLNKYAMNIWLSSLRIRAHLSWRTGKHLHVLHVLRTYSTCSHPYLIFVTDPTDISV